MKKIILLLFILLGICIKVDAGLKGTTNLPRLGTFSKVIMPDEYHMQFEINFEDSDFFLSNGNFMFKGEDNRGNYMTWPDGDWLYSWMDYGTNPNIPTSVFHLLVPNGKRVAQVEYDTTGTHLYTTNYHYYIAQPGDLSYRPNVKPRNFVLEYNGLLICYEPCHTEEFMYRPCIYDTVNHQNVWMYKKLSIRLTLKDTITTTGGESYTGFLLYKQFQLINPYDLARFYPEIYAGIETLETGKQSYLRIRSKNELEGSLSETTQKAYIEIRNGLGQHVRSVAVSERGVFSINLDSENVSPGFYLCTLVADGKRIGTTKIIVEP